MSTENRPRYPHVLEVSKPEETVSRVVAGNVVNNTIRLLEKVFEEDLRETTLEPMDPVQGGKVFAILGTVRELSKSVPLQENREGKIERHGAALEKKRIAYQVLVEEGKKEGQIDILPKKQREVLEKKYLGKDGRILSNRKTAFELNTTVKNVIAHELDGLRRLAKRLNKEELFKERKSFHKDRISWEERRRMRHSVVKKGIERGLFDLLSIEEKRAIEALYLNQDGPIPAVKAASVLEKKPGTVRAQEFSALKRLSKSI